MKKIIEYVNEELNENIFWLLDKWFDANAENKQEFIELISMYKNDKSVIKNFINSIDIQKLKEFITFIYDDPSMKFDDNYNYEYTLKNILDKIISNKSMFNKYDKQNKKISEGLKIGKSFKFEQTHFPEDKNELKKIIKDTYNEAIKSKEITLDLKFVNVSKVKDMSSVFANLEKIKYINLFNWDTSSCTNFTKMFAGCKDLIEVKGIENFNTKNVTSMAGMFANCENLKTIGDISKWNVSEVKNTDQMFMKCKNLEYVGNLSDWDLMSVTYSQYMFFGCKKLDFKDLDTKNWKHAYKIGGPFMFKFCKGEPKF